MPSTDTDQYLPTGTSGHVVPFLDGANTWSDVQTFESTAGLGSTIMELSNGAAFPAVTFITSPNGARMLFHRTTDGTVFGNLGFIDGTAGVVFTDFPTIHNSGINSEGTVNIGAFSPLNVSGPINSYAGTNLRLFPEAGRAVELSGSLDLPVSSVSGDQTLALGSSYYQEYTGVGGHTWTLPARAGNVGITFRIKNIGSGADLIISRAGADQIFSSAAVNTINAPVGATVDITAGNTYWNATIIL